MSLWPRCTNLAVCDSRLATHPAKQVTSTHRLSTEDTVTHSGSLAPQHHEPTHIIGASIPRSGHHLLTRLLEAALGECFFYCEMYGEPGCCREVPCRSRGQRQVSFQKNHDFELSLPTDVPGSLYLIQHREPVAVALSAREYYAREDRGGGYGETLAADRGDYAVWLGRLAAYYVGFSERWLVTPPKHSLAVDYENLSAHPRDVLAGVISLTGVALDAEVLDQAVARVVGRAGHFGEYAFVRKALEMRRYYDRDLLATYESIIVEHVPSLAERRTFAPVEYRGTVVGHVFEARRHWQHGDAIAALAAVERALVSHGSIGLLLYEQAVYLQALCRHDEAGSALRRAIALPPPHPDIMDALISLSLSLNDLETARATAADLVALLGTERAGPVAAGLSDVDGPAQGRGMTERSRHELVTDADTIRELRGEVVVREIASRQAELRLLEKERQIAAISAAAQARLDQIGELTGQLGESDRASADLEATAQERLELIERLTAELAERERVIKELVLAAQQQLELLERATASHGQVVNDD
jgi:hypothetical protein